VALLSNRIKYVAKDTSVPIDGSLENNNDTTSANNDTEDEDDDRAKLYMKFKQIQKERQSHDGHKTHQLLQEELITNITKQMNVHREGMFTFGFD
jgi:hypothetical protein